MARGLSLVRRKAVVALREGRAKIARGNGSVRENELNVAMHEAPERGVVAGVSRDAEPETESGDLRISPVLGSKARLHGQTVPL